VDASLFETQISLLTNVGLSWLNLGVEAERWGCQHPSIAPYNAFKTKDLYLVCGATNDKQFVKFCNLLGVGALAKDERFKTNASRVEHRAVLNPIFDAIFATKTTAEWEVAFEGSGLAYAPINNMERTFAHPQTEARDMIERIPFDVAESGQINVIGMSVDFNSVREIRWNSADALPPQDHQSSSVRLRLLFEQHLLDLVNIREKYFWSSGLRTNKQML
jgi:succinate--hydroxymethylglutarate CoA-transferase